MTASTGALQALNTHLHDVLVEGALDQEPGQTQFNGLDLLGADEDTAATFLPAEVVDRLADTTITVSAEHTFSRTHQRTIVDVVLTLNGGSYWYIDDDASKVTPLNVLGLPDPPPPEATAAAIYSAAIEAVGAYLESHDHPIHGRAPRTIECDGYRFDLATEHDGSWEPDAGVSGAMVGTETVVFSVYQGDVKVATGNTTGAHPDPESLTFETIT